MQRRKVFERWKTLDDAWSALLTWEGHCMLHLVVFCIFSSWGSRYEYVRKFRWLIGVNRQQEVDSISGKFKPECSPTEWLERSINRTFWSTIILTGKADDEAPNKVRRALGQTE
jgi:hypothetical protein